MQQISMDGPNVNWKFFKLFQEKMEENHNKQLLNVGSCGLHIVHNAFKKGSVSSGWGIDKLLSSLYYLYKDTHARREDFTTATGSKVFPLKFCGHRWVENVGVAERAMEIWPNIIKYVAKVNSGVLTKPDTVSFREVNNSSKDMLTPAKIACFTSIAQQVMPFLKVFQADKPMIPFICEDLFRIVKGLMDHFIKSEVMLNITQVEDLVKIDINNKENYCKNKEIVVGFVAGKELKILLSAKKVSERQALEFRNECRSFLVSVINEMTEKTPLKYPLAKHLSCFDPRAMARDEAGSKRKMKSLLNALVSAKRLNVSQCDEILWQYSEYLDTVAKVKMQYREFDPYVRLDSLLSENMGRQPQSLI